MLSALNLASLAAVSAPHFQTPEGGTLSLLIRTEAPYSIPHGLQTFWRAYGTAIAAAADQLPRALQSHAPGPLDALVADGTGQPSVIMAGSPPARVADRFFHAAADSESLAFMPLIGRLARLPAPSAPQRAGWQESGRAAFTLPNGPLADNVLKVATLLAVARDAVAPAVEAGDVVLALRIVEGG